MKQAHKPSRRRAGCEARGAAKTKWEHFEHGADIGVRGFGESIGASFEQAAMALTAVVTDCDRVGQTTRVDLHCSAGDPELLLVDWLNAVVYEMAVNKLVFGRYSVAVSGTELQGAAWGEPLDTRRHRPAVEVKGATFTALRVERLEDGTWVAQTVVDV